MAFCTACGSQVEDQNFCGKCGANLRPTAAIPSPASPPVKWKANGCLVVLLVVVGIFVILAIVGSLSDRDGSSSRPSESTSTPAVKTQTTGNEANDRLFALTKNGQASALGVVIGEGCVGRRAFYMGSSPSDHSAFWSVGCTNGKSYLVQVFADATGRTSVLDCGVYRLTTKMRCFEKIKDAQQFAE
jgi:hypothetical protein